MSAIRAIRLSVVSLSMLACAGVTMPASAQSLADVARKEEERRQKVAEPTKVYTNKDLKNPSGGTAPAAPATRDAPAVEAPKAAGSDAGASSGTGAAGKDDPKDPLKNAAFWSGKLKTLQSRLDQDQAFAEAMQTRINSLTADAVNRDDPIQRGKLERDRQKAIADLAGLTKAIAADKKAIADLHEQARRAGVPPGWLR